MGQERFAYFCLGRHSGFSKVSRCKSGTLSGRYRRNGYVHGPTVLTVRPSSRGISYICVGCQAVTGASSLATDLASCRSCVDTYGHRRQTSSHFLGVRCVRGWFADWRATRSGLLAACAIAPAPSRWRPGCIAEHPWPSPARRARCRSVPRLPLVHLRGCGYG